MIPAALLALVLVLPAVTARSALAISFAECQAWLCLPGGFPPSECTPAEDAVKRRLAAFQPPLPPWSSCASRFGWDAANLSYTQNTQDECPHGGTPTGGLCSGVGADGCAFSYSAQKTTTVKVAVDGRTNFSPNVPHVQRVATAGTPVIDQICTTQTTIPGTCATPVAGPTPVGGRPTYWRVTTGCRCPPGYPFRWPAGSGQEYCLYNPGRP